MVVAVVTDATCDLSAAALARLGVAVVPLGVTVEVDGWDASSLTWWSVLLKGHAEVVDDERELEAFVATGVAPWSAQELRDTWVVLRPTEVSGRRLVPTIDGR